MNGADIRNFVPLSRIVKAALVDHYEDAGKGLELYYHWAGRGARKLNMEVLKQGKRYAMLTVNQNTHTATLPTDFSEALFVGVLGENGMKMPLSSNDNIANKYNIQTDTTSERCKVCNSPKNICEDLSITETSNLIVIGDNTYEQTIIKKLYPNGDYYLETTTPYRDMETDTIVYNTSKEFISHLDLKPCGCIDDTEANLSVLQNIRPDVYCCYYSGCSADCRTDMGSYRIFEENGLIQFDYSFKFDKVYIEYLGSMPKIKGQLSVPEVAFEPLVEWIKFKSVEGKKNISNPDKRFRWDMYTTARRNMEKILGRVSLSAIVDAATRVPKFNVTYQTDWASMFNWDEQYRKALAASLNGVGNGGSGTGTNGNDGGNGGNGSGGGGTTVINNTNFVENKMPPALIVNGVSFNSEGTWAAPLIYKNLDFLIFWNGLRYLTRNEYLVDSTNGLVTILLGDKPFSPDDNYIFFPQNKIA